MKALILISTALFSFLSFASSDHDFAVCHMEYEEGKVFNFRNQDQQESRFFSVESDDWSLHGHLYLGRFSLEPVKGDRRIELNWSELNKNGIPRLGVWYIHQEYNGCRPGERGCNKGWMTTKKVTALDHVFHKGESATLNFSSEYGVHFNCKLASLIL